MPNILPIIILYNSKAGKGRAVHIVDFIIKKLTGIGVSFNSYDKQWPEQLSEYKEVWLVGGDGTLNFFINKYPDCKIPVALFKGGSGNDFAWKLYGNIKTEAYFETALNGRIVFTDAGCCNSRLFINGAGVGFDGETVRNMGAKKFLSAGHIAYLIVVVKTIFKYRESKMKVCFNDKVLQKEYLMITIANGSRYGGGFMVAPQADIFDGNLDVIFCDKLNVIKRLINLPKIEKGIHLELPFVNYTTAKQISIETQFPVAAQLDGELLVDNKFELEILPQRFQFKVPKGA